MLKEVKVKKVLVNFKRTNKLGVTFDMHETIDLEVGLYGNFDEQIFNAIERLYPDDKIEYKRNPPFGSPDWETICPGTPIMDTVDY